MELTVRALEYVVAVADEGHFGRAATRMCVSAPALSRQIKSIEDAYCLTIFDRSGHPVQPTPDGEEFVRAARQALENIAQVHAIGLAAGRRSSGTLRVGFTFTLPTGLTSAILDTFRQLRPDVDVQLVELEMAEQVSAVYLHDVDAAFVWSPYHPDERLRFESVLEECRVVALPIGHPLASRQSIEIAEIAEEKLLRLDDDVVRGGMVTADWVAFWSVDPRPDGSHPLWGPAARTVEGFTEHVAASRAVFITNPSIASNVAHPGVVFVPITDVPPSTLSLCTIARDRSPLVEALRRIAREVRTRG